MMLPVRYEFFLASALEKVFPDERPMAMDKGARLSCWRGTRASVQLVYYAEPVVPGSRNELRFDLSVEGAPVQPSLRTVELIPVHLAYFEGADDMYLRYEPGLYPDLLKPMQEPIVTPRTHQYHTVWLTFDIPEDVAPGQYDVKVTAKARPIDDSPTGKPFVTREAEGLAFTNTFTLNVCKAVMPEQTLIHTEWFHCDCLCQYYGVKAMSEDFWRITENFISRAVHHGINMILTPIFTPPLDTGVGKERMTIQLVDVGVKDGSFTFDFSKLERWLDICRRHGAGYLEIPHFFTQWGATATPKIVATIDGREQRIFGWDIPATSIMYRAFLEELIPQLQAVLEKHGYDKQHVYYHVSDEPKLDQLEDYKAARAVITDLLEGCPIIDALSNVEFYHEGVVEHPVPANNHIKPFLDAQVKDLWTYYCCGQGHTVPNRFIAMPSARNRIMGTLMYHNNIVGFLQWGYNFYNSRCSGHPIDPFTQPDNEYAYPAGDSFIVYPGPNGEPLDSLRAEVQYDGFLDMRALQLLESVAGRKAAGKALFKGITEELSFDDYPREDDYLLALRERVADAIDAALS